MRQSERLAAYREAMQQLVLGGFGTPADAAGRIYNRLFRHRMRTTMSLSIVGVAGPNQKIR